MAEDNYSQKKFGFCKILWNIENFFLTACTEDWEIISPEFVVKAAHLTTWKITLKSSANKDDKGSNIISVRLGRSNDSGPDVVRANWKMSLLSQERTESIFTDSCRYFRKNCWNEEDLLGLEKALNACEPFDQNGLYLQCLLIVSIVPKFSKNFQENINVVNSLSKKLSVFYPSPKIRDAVVRKHEEGISSLSEDLAILYSSRQGFDITIKIDNGNIVGHKAVLCARNSTLASICDKDFGLTSIDLSAHPLYDQCRAALIKNGLSSVNSDELERIFAYLYSGNIDTVACTPSVSLYEYAVVLDITEVINLYNPDELILHSSVDVAEFVIFWTVINFEITSVDHILSPVFKDGVTDTSWRLRLLPEGSEKHEQYISIFAEIVDGMKQQVVSLEFAIMDANGTFTNYRRLLKTINMGGILGFYDFINKDCLENSSFIDNGTLRIIFKLQMAGGIQTSIIKCSSEASVSTAFTEDCAFKLLADDMANLFEEGEYSDTVILCENEIFNVHRYILAARTTDAFFKFLSENITGKNEFTVPDINPQLFRILLRYMYSGCIGEYDKTIIRDLYRLGDKFDMFDLLLKCKKILYG